MPNGKTEEHQALDDFRTAIIEIFADLRARIDALEDAALNPSKSVPLTAAKMKTLRTKARKDSSLGTHYAEELPSPYERRR
jgi:hypothetical protein